MLQRSVPFCGRSYTSKTLAAADEFQNYPLERQRIERSLRSKNGELDAQNIWFAAFVQIRV
jgi:hypothetical protein